MTFEEAVSRHSALIAKICYYFSDNPEDFKDLRQETLLNLWHGWTQFRGEAARPTWIYRVCFNSCVTFKRKNKRRPQIAIDSVLDVAEEDSFTLEDYNELHTLIAQLSPENKAILLMWLDEKSYEDIAHITGLNRNAVATRLHRIKRYLVKLSQH